jgi:hypothetical protein
MVVRGFTSGASLALRVGLPPDTLIQSVLLFAPDLLFAPLI